MSQIQKKKALTTLGVVVFFGLLWLLDYPKPMEDDLYYTGAALHMVDGGDFSNPLIERQENPSHLFYVYPPLHSYVLDVWLKVFGVSAASMTALPIFLCIITSISGIAILHANRAPQFIYWLTPLAACTAILPTGLRAEAVSIGLTMVGLAVAECGTIGLWVPFAAMLLMALGGSAAPRIACFSGALIIFSGYKMLKYPENYGKKKTIMISISAALACAVGIFLAQINFQVAEFWHAFNTHAHLISGSVSIIWGWLGIVYFMNENPYLNGSQAPLVWTLGALLIFALPKQKSKLTMLGFALMAGFLMETIAHGLGAGVLWYLAFALLLFSSTIINNAPQIRLRLGGLLVLLFLLANSKYIVAEYLQLRGRITTELGDKEKEAREIRSTPEHPILIDSYTARYIYDYRIPAGFLDIQFAAPFPKFHIMEAPRKNDVYVIGARNVEILRTQTLLAQPIKERVVFGLPNRHFLAEARRVYIIQAEECPSR